MHLVSFIIRIYRPVQINLLLHKGHLTTLQILRRPQISVNSKSLSFFYRKIYTSDYKTKITINISKD